MEWTTQTVSAMRSWLASAISYNSGPNEDDKLYLFVAHVWHDQKKVWDEAHIRDVFRREAKELGDDPDSDHVSEVIRIGLSKGTMLLEFLSLIQSTPNIKILTD